MLTSIEISRNGTRLVALIRPLGCRVLNLEDRRTVWQQAKLGLGVRPYLSPSGRYLLLYSLLGHLEIVDLDTQEVIRRNLPEPNTGKVVFTPEDDCVLVPQGDNTALLNWRTNSLRTLFPGSPSSISDDGRWMVTESNGRKLTLWTLPEERRMATFTLDAPILHTALSPDGRFLIAGDQSGNVHILKRQG
jgi:WD40 repeat protein